MGKADDSIRLLLPSEAHQRSHNKHTNVETFSILYAGTIAAGSIHRISISLASLGLV